MVIGSLTVFAFEIIILFPVYKNAMCKAGAFECPILVDAGPIFWIIQQPTYLHPAYIYIFLELIIAVGLGWMIARIGKKKDEK